MEFLASTEGTQGNPQTVRYFWELILFSIGHLESSTEVQMNSLQKVSSPSF